MLGIIGGSGLAEFAELEQSRELQLDTRYGAPSSSVIVGTLAGVDVAFLARHGRPHRIPPHKVNYRANILALQELGVEGILAVNATGGISAMQQPGVISIPDQLIDYTHSREHTFWDGTEHPMLHVDFTHPYTDTLRQRLIRAASEIGLVVVTQGVYGVMQGPRLETAAEISRMAKDGCDVVGMTGMPEAGLAREAGVDYAAISLVVNRAAGLAPGLITLEEIERVMVSGMVSVKQLIEACCRIR
jgi:5'-methylthioinosine phosphorylase